MKNTQFLNIFIHLLFCTGTILFFRYNSFLRPLAMGATYKEYIAGAIVLSVCYVLYPQLYLKRRYASYLTISILSLVIASLAEEMLVYRQVFDIVQYLNINFPIYIYFVEQILYLFMRDACFVLFIFFVCTIHYLNKEKEDISQYLSHHNHLIVAKNHHNATVTIPIKDITHCQQIENYAKIHLINGKSYTRNCSMSTLVEDLGPNYSVRISRSNIVMYAYIQSFDNTTVFILTSEGVMGFNITKSYKEHALSMLKSHIMNEAVINKNENLHENISTKHEYKHEEVTKSCQETHTAEMTAYQLVLDFIKDHPNCKGSDIMQFCHFSLSTVNRILKQLKQEGLIEYTGSKKTGGYRICQKSTAQDQTSD